jgi:hypothetical protein
MKSSPPFPYRIKGARTRLIVRQEQEWARHRYLHLEMWEHLRFDCVSDHLRKTGHEKSLFWKLLNYKNPEYDGLTAKVDWLIRLEVININ